MGVYLGLDILPLEIDPGEWNGFYDEALALARAFPLPLQRLDAENKSGYYRFFLTRRIEGRNEFGRFLSIVGDGWTRQRGEDFTLYRDIGFYRRRIYGPKHKGQDDEDLSDTLFRGRRPVRVFHEKTQSCPYHDFIWCIITLAENLFPGRACATGNLAARDWAHSLRWLTGIKGKPFDIPLLLDPERLWDVLAQRDSGLVQKTSEEQRGDQAAIYRLLVSKNITLCNSWAKDRLKQNAPGTIGALGECLHILDGTGNLYDLVRMACLDSDGPRWELEQVLSIAHALGAFDSGPTGPARAVGFLPAEFVPRYYRTRAYFEEEEASRKIAGMAGVPVERVRNILHKLQAERVAPQRTGDTNVTPGTFELPYPEQEVELFRKAIACDGKNWDGTTLHALIAAADSEKHVVLTEETWQVIDREQDPAVLTYVLAKIAGYTGFDRENAFLAFLFSHLIEIREAWRSGSAWTCAEDELAPKKGDWWAQPQTSAE
ncbi:MAG TPA: hypothetical protein VMW83_12320 [Spirochaetia bacterium]|nr:hypothetical protein [Spirochaetia bacterium]